MDISRHPITGLHYRHVISSESAAFGDAYRCHKYASETIPWISVISTGQYKSIVSDKSSDYYINPNIMYVLWHHWDTCFGDYERRQARLAIHYSEIIGDQDRLFDRQKEMFNRFINDIDKFDLVFVHTKWGESYLRKSFNHVYYAPVGFESNVVGKPDFDAKKYRDLIFYGTISDDHSTFNKRHAIIKPLQQQLRHKFEMVVVGYGEMRKSVLNKTKAVLHVPHNDGCSFATMRLWQNIGSSAAMLIEPTDAWPAIPDRHYFQIPTITTDNIKESADIIDNILDAPDRLLNVARIAYSELSKYTVEYCHNNYIIPANTKL